MKKKWITPGGPIYTLYRDMMEQPHLLIAGATGSGKSVTINGIIYTALHSAPGQAEFILIDPKRVELSQYRYIPHTIAYASEPADIIAALNLSMQITEQRFFQMQSQGVRKYDGGHIYIIIDELADLMTTNKRQVQPLIQRLAQIGRAANVHIIAATQCPLREVIPTPIKVNFDARVALRTRSAQDSRNILGERGCENLPRFGQGFYMTPDGLTLYNLPMIPDADIADIVTYWKKQTRGPLARLIFR